MNLVTLKAEILTDPASLGFPAMPSRRDVPQVLETEIMAREVHEKDLQHDDKVLEEDKGLEKGETKETAQVRRARDISEEKYQDALCEYDLLVARMLNAYGESEFHRAQIPTISGADLALSIPPKTFAFLTEGEARYLTLLCSLQGQISVTKLKPIVSEMLPGIDFNDLFTVKSSRSNALFGRSVSASDISEARGVDDGV